MKFRNLILATTLTATPLVANIPSVAVFAKSAQLVAKEKELVSLTNAYNEAVTAQDTLSNSVSTLTSNIETVLKPAQAEAQGNVTSQQAEVATAQNALNAKTNAVNEAQSTFDDVEGQLNTMQTAKDGGDDTITDEEINAMSVIVDGARTSLENAKTERQTALDNYNMHNNALTALQGKLEEANNALASAQANLEALTTEYTNAVQATENAKVLMEKKQAEVTELAKKEQETPNIPTPNKPQYDPNKVLSDANKAQEKPAQQGLGAVKGNLAEIADGQGTGVSTGLGFTAIAGMVGSVAVVGLKRKKSRN